MLKVLIDLLHALYVIFVANFIMANVIGWVFFVAWLHRHVS